MKEFRRISGVLLAAALVLPSLTSCDLVGSLGDLAESLRAEQAQYQGVEGPIDTTPPPIVRPGDGVGGGGKDDPGDEKEPAEITPGEEDPEKLPSDPSLEEEEDAKISGPLELTLANVLSVNRIAKLVSRYGCVAAKSQTPNGERTTYYYHIDSPGGRALVRLSDMRGTPFGCFGDVWTYDGRPYYFTSANIEDAYETLELSPDTALAEDPSARSKEEFLALYQTGMMKTLEKGETETVVEVVSVDGVYRSELKLDAHSLEILSKTDIDAEGVRHETVFTRGADRIGADRLTARIASVYAIDPEDMPFTLDDVRRANSVASLIGQYGLVGFTEDWGGAVEHAVCRDLDGHRVVRVSNTDASGESTVFYQLDGISYPDSTGTAFRFCESAASPNNLLSALVPDGEIGNVTEASSSVLFTVSYQNGSRREMAKIVVEKDSLRLLSSELDAVTEAGTERLNTVTFEYGEENSPVSPAEREADAKLTAALADTRTATYHVKWTNAPEETFVYEIPKSWPFRLMFYSDPTYWYNEDMTDQAGGATQVHADAWNYEIWVKDAYRYDELFAKSGPEDGEEGADGTSPAEPVTVDLPGKPPADVTLDAIANANRLSVLIGRYDSFAEERKDAKGGTVTEYFWREGNSTVQMLEEPGKPERGMCGVVLAEKRDDGSYITYAVYNDVVKGLGAAAVYERFRSDLFTVDWKDGVLLEPDEGDELERHFLVGLTGTRFVRMTVLRDSLAVVSLQVVENGETVAERRTFFGRKPEGGFPDLWRNTRTAVYHVLNNGTQVAEITMNVPKTAPFRLDLPTGWNWFYADAGLRTSVDRWYQVPPAETNAELWADNRDPSTLPPPEEPKTEEPKPVEPGGPEQPSEPTGQSGDNPGGGGFGFLVP